MTSSPAIAGPADGTTGTRPGIGPDAAHREDHTDLLAHFQPGAFRPVDAVVVPVGRSAVHLSHAAELARHLGASLVAMYGPDRCIGPDDIAAALSEWPDLRWHAVEVTAQPTHPLLAFGAPMSDRRRPLNLLSVKRNAALLLGRMLGWRAVLLLDDDIEHVDPALVETAASGLDEHRAVALTVTDWPDNSVVCHANRRGGGQSVFVSGAALVVDTTRPFGFFPDVYNEDWVFLFDWLREGALAALSGVRQLRYDPYDEPDRARRQEFGEVVAEGMVDLLHRGNELSALTGSGYWAGFLGRRRRFIARARARLVPGPDGSALAALDAAERVRRTIRPEACARFVAEHGAAVARWSRQVDRLPPAADVVGAAACLGLRVGASSPATAVRPAASPQRASDHPPCDDLVVVLPGFLDTIEYASTSRLVEDLSAGGAEVVAHELHGAWTGEARITHEYRTSRHLADIRRVLDAHDCGCRRRTVVVGFCYGAQLAALIAARDPRVTDVVALMPMWRFIWSCDYEVGKDRWRHRGPRSFPRDPPGDGLELRTFEVPYTVVQDALRHDSAAAFRSLRRQRVLFVSGQDDAYTPASVVERLHRLCDNPSAQHLVLPGVQHDYRSNPAQVTRVNAAVLDWLWPRPGGPVVHAAAEPSMQPGGSSPELGATLIAPVLHDGAWRAVGTPDPSGVPRRSTSGSERS